MYLIERYVVFDTYLGRVILVQQLSYLQAARDSFNRYILTVEFYAGLQ